MSFPRIRVSPREGGARIHFKIDIDRSNHTELHEIINEITAFFPVICELGKFQINSNSCVIANKVQQSNGPFNYIRLTASHYEVKFVMPLCVLE